MQSNVVTPLSAGESQPVTSQPKRTPRWLIPLAILLILIAAIFLLDFHAMKSQSTAESQTGTYRSGEIDINWKNTPVDTALYVEAPGNLKNALRNSIKPLIQNKNYVGAVSDLNAPADSLSIPQLYVQVIPVDTFWTPFYARSKYQVIVSYASNGDLSFRNQKPVRFEGMPGQPAILFQSTNDMVDTSWGFISLKGYHSFIASKIAAQVVDNLVIKE